MFRLGLHLLLRCLKLRFDLVNLLHAAPHIKYLRTERRFQSSDSLLAKFFKLLIAFFLFDQVHLEELVFQSERIVLDGELWASVFVTGSVSALFTSTPGLESCPKQVDVIGYVLILQNALVPLTEVGSRERRHVNLQPLDECLDLGHPCIHGLSPASTQR